jgi:hypothetical protein
MQLTSDTKTRLIAEVSDPNGTIASLVSSVWGAFDAQGMLAPDLQYLYTKRSLLDIRLGEEQASISFTIVGDVTDNQNQRFDHLQQMRNDCQAEIVRVESLMRSTRPGATGTLAKTEIYTPPWGPDANAARYIGSPYTRIRRVD